MPLKFKCNNWLNVHDVHENVGWVFMLLFGVFDFDFDSLDLTRLPVMTLGETQPWVVQCRLPSLFGFAIGLTKSVRNHQDHTPTFPIAVVMAKSDYLVTVCVTI